MEHFRFNTAISKIRPHIPVMVTELVVLVLDLLDGFHEVKSLELFSIAFTGSCGLANYRAAPNP